MSKQATALVKTGNGKYKSPCGTFSAERVRYRDWWGDYRWAYEVAWRGNLRATYGRHHMPGMNRPSGDRIYISSPYGGRPVCHTLAEARSIVARYIRQAVTA